KNNAPCAFPRAMAALLKATQGKSLTRERIEDSATPSRAGQIRRIEMRALHLGADAMHHAGANLAAALQRAGNLLQEGIATLDGNRLRGSHHGVEFGIR